MVGGKVEGVGSRNSMEFIFKWECVEGQKAVREWTAQKCAARNGSNDCTRFDDDGKKTAEKVELLEGVLD